MHKVQADYLMWRNDKKWLNDVDLAMGFAGIWTMNEAERIEIAREDNNKRGNRIIFALLNWATERSEAIRIGLSVLKKRVPHENDGLKISAFIETLCDMALEIPVVTRGEAD